MIKKTPLTHTRSPEELGRLIARAHYQAWRTDAPPFDLTIEELAAILPNLIRSGSAGIVWHRVKPVRERYGALAFALEAATDAQIAHNQRIELAIVKVVTRLRAYGIEPVLVKGLALVRLYPEGIVRPAGDIDLVVRKHEFAAAHAILNDSTRDRIPIEVDLKHPGIWEEAPNHDFWERLETVEVADVPLQVLGPGDNLAMICFHFLKHGGQRPLWLCDFGLTYEFPLRRRWLGEVTPRQQSWLTAMTTVTSHLVGTTVPSKECVMPVPSWIIAGIFDQWTTPRDVIRRGALTQFIDDPRSLPAILAEAWPTPIAATFWQAAPISQNFSLAWQIREFCRRFNEHVRLRMVRQFRTLD